jgi:uncharacterized DUF497 family protein
MDFEWDEAKAAANEQKHGVAFTEGERRDYEDGNFP